MIDSILCFEDHCLIIRSINLNSLHQILEKTNSVVFDLNSTDKEYDLIKQEISSFIYHFENDIKENEFIKTTIEPAISYIIRRHFFPSNYFKNSNFFKFTQNPNEKQKQKFDYSEFKPQEIFDKIEKDKKKINNKYQLEGFVDDNFIQLRKIFENSNTSFYLVLHVESFYIFMMKVINNDKNEKFISHEIDFCKNYSHRCLTKFYGFVKKDEKITGFVYEFMCNGTLYDYLTGNKNNVDKNFSYMTMIRIAQGIKYLHSNSLIHRDIKPFNILINHDNIPFLSDFDSIRKIDEFTSEITHDIGSIKYISPEQYQDSNYSFPTDIYSFGQMIYFLFEQKDYFENANNVTIIDEIKKIQLSVESNIPKSLQNIFKKCVLFDAKDRLTINDILNEIKIEADSFWFLELSHLKKNHILC